LPGVRGIGLGRIPLYGGLDDLAGDNR
jgi:hypothetical protein